MTELVWPGLMLGQLMFARAGVRVRAGANHAQHGVADRSTALRDLPAPLPAHHRPLPRLGPQLQWDTDFRRDYRTHDAVHLNIDAREEIDTPVPEDDHEALLTAAERRDLLRHRCLRTPDAAPALGRRDPHW